MKVQIFRFIGACVLATMLLAVITEVWASDKASDQGLVGSWNLTVTLRDCDNGTALVVFPAMNTYHQGGTTSQTAIPNSPFRDLPGHGAWNHRTGRTYSGGFQFFSLTPDGGTYVGKVVVRSDISLGIGGNDYSSTDTAEVYDPAGNLITRGCSTTSATRFE
jgi:hypothetical protein